MKRSDQPVLPLERVVLVLTLALLLFATPVIYWWAQDDSPWFVVYLLWLIIIGLSAWSYASQRNNDL